MGGARGDPGWSTAVADAPRARAGTNSAVVFASPCRHGLRLHWGFLGTAGNLSRWVGDRVFRAHGKGQERDLGAATQRTQREEARRHRGRVLSVLVGRWEVPRVLRRLSFEEDSRRRRPGDGARGGGQCPWGLMEPGQRHHLRARLSRLPVADPGERRRTGTPYEV